MIKQVPQSVPTRCRRSSVTLIAVIQGWWVNDDDNDNNYYNKNNNYIIIIIIIIMKYYYDNMFFRENNLVSMKCWYQRGPFSKVEQPLQTKMQQLKYI